MVIDQPKILCLFSAPLVTPAHQPVDALDLDSERDTIVRQLAACNRQIALRIGTMTVDELDQGISDHFNILHLSCHGNQEFLLFEDGRGGSHTVPGDYLKRLIGTGGPFELALVSACHSEKIGKMLNEAGIRHVVAVRYDVPVLDKAATTFAEHFYRHLIRGEPLQKTFEMTKLLVEGNPELSKIKPKLELMASRKGEAFVPEEDKFVLLPSDDPSFHFDPLISNEIPKGKLSIKEIKKSKTNLPGRPNSFTGRSTEMYSVINKLLANQLVTVTGAGGIGKTTLAVEVARWFHSRGHFQDGIFHIDLRQTDTVGGITALIAANLELPSCETKDVIEFMRNCQCLILLDNMEDVLWKEEKEAQNLINEILKFCKGIKLLVTSQREIGGNLCEPEKIDRVFPLEISNSANLFLVSTKREITKQEFSSDAFIGLLNKLGGHPLSIVLVARQLKNGTSIEDLIRRIEEYKASAISVKGITDRGFEHGESLVASLATSYDNLSEDSKIIFGALSMLPAGAEEFTIKQIFGDKGWEQVQELHDASLVEITEYRRVFLLPPVRLFALSVITDETKEMYGPRIMALMGSYAKQFYDNLGSKDAKKYHQFFALEEPNLRFAAELQPPIPETENGFSILGFLGTYLLNLYIYTDRCNEGKKIGEVVAANLGKLDDKMGEANTLQVLGDLSMRTDNPKDAKERYEDALGIYQSIDSKLGEANALKALGDLSMRTDDLKEAKERYEEALGIYQSIDEKVGEANALKALGDFSMRTDDLKDAKERYEEALGIYQSIDEKVGEANALKALGDFSMRTDDLKDAKERYEEALGIYQSIDDKVGEANALKALGDFSMRTDDLKDAKKRYEEALGIYQSIDSKLGEANTLQALGDLSMRTDNLKDAKERYEEALGIYQSIDSKLGEANTLQALGQYFALIDKLEPAGEKFDNAYKMYKEIDDNEGQADVHMGKAIVFLKRHENPQARTELYQCVTIRDKVLAHGEAAQWLIIFSDKLKSQNFIEGAKICLEYAGIFASKARDTRLQNQIEQRLRDL